jgi:hypothetical protein
VDPGNDVSIKPTDTVFKCFACLPLFGNSNGLEPYICNEIMLLARAKPRKCFVFVLLFLCSLNSTYQIIYF